MGVVQSGCEVHPALVGILGGEETEKCGVKGPALCRCGKRSVARIAGAHREVVGTKFRKLRLYQSVCVSLNSTTTTQALGLGHFTQGN